MILGISTISLWFRDFASGTSSENRNTVSLVISCIGTAFQTTMHNLQLTLLLSVELLLGSYMLEVAGNQAIIFCSFGFVPDLNVNLKEVLTRLADAVKL